MNSRQKLGWTLVLILVVFCCVFGTLAFVSRFSLFGLLVGPEETGQAHLNKLARSASPIIQGLERYRAEHQRFPTDPRDLTPYLPAVPATPASANHNFIRGWYYHRDETGQGYSLAYKVDRDPNLIYVCDGSTAHWEFDPGDGTPSKVLQLKP
jgi:hypothetical protein